MSETPTPETDSVTRSSDETPWTPWVCAGHAKRLERERDDAIKEWDAAREGWSKALEERDEARMKLAQIEEYGTKEINEAVTLRQECSRLKVVLRELLAIMPRATCENLPHDSLDVHPRSTHCWALQHFNDTVKVAKGLVYPPF